MTEGIYNPPFLKKRPCKEKMTEEIHSIVSRFNMVLAQTLL